MAAISFPRSRSPVMSIRTQPEEESTLRAEIEAANRTQHELLPRYSWHQAILRKDHSNALRQMYPPVLPRESLPSSLARPFKADNDPADDQCIPIPNVTRDGALLRQSTDAKRSWRQFTKRTTKPSANPSSPTTISTTTNAQKVSGRKKKSRTSQKHVDEVVADYDRAAQHAQFNAWLEERLEEQNTVADLQQPQLTKSKRTIRKSIYGSLSSTKRLFRNTSKGHFESLNIGALPNTLHTPHVYSFETKDQLRDYLNSTSVLSPLSPIEQQPLDLDISKSTEPAELSAGPLPAELEGNSPSTADSKQSAESRMSIPSLRDLPPYNDEKKYLSDIVKEPGLHSDSCNIVSRDGTLSAANVSYFCNSCRTEIAGHDVYDFCSICDSGDRVLCVRCAERGPCCRHELEELLRHCPSTPATKSTQPQKSGRIQRKPVAITGQPNHDEAIPDRNVSLVNEPGTFDTLSSLHVSLSKRLKSESNSDSHGVIETDIKDVQLHLLKEMGYVRREQELTQRERDLELRAREVEIRNQQTTLREREAIVQQKSDLLMRNLESLVSYQELAKSAFIGAQFQAKQGDYQKDIVSGTYSPSGCELNRAESIALDSCERQAKRHSAVSKVVAEVEASMEGFVSTDSQIRSHTTQKRKKESANASVSSTPAGASPPEQSRKSVSRGNSERSGGQNEEDDDDDESRRHPKKHKQGPVTPHGPQLLFACPYSKNNPARFSSRNTQEKNYRGCATHYLPDVSRLKQHLKRVHWQPENYCPRCYEEFEDASKLSEHAGAPVACEAKDCPFPEKMDKTQQEKIHVKRPRVAPATVWYDIYKVLFPDVTELPQNPYMDADDRIVTPVSATPESTNTQATETLSRIFNGRLDQFDELQDGSIRKCIQQALMESFTDFLNHYSVSPHASPGAAPSIIVSPVSRSSSGTTRPFESPLISQPKPPQFEHNYSTTNIISQLQHVPLLQEPKPPRSRRSTALQVPPDHHRSPATASRPESAASGSPIDMIFPIHIPSHVQEDRGYDDECDSFEHGDDQEAMFFAKEPGLPSYRNNSGRSLDSGYGSNRSFENPMRRSLSETPALQLPNTSLDRNSNSLHNDGMGLPKIPIPMTHPSQIPTVHGVASNQSGQDMDSMNDFPSYFDYLDPMSRGMLDEYPFSDSHNPWLGH